MCHVPIPFHPWPLMPRPTAPCLISIQTLLTSFGSRFMLVPLQRDTWAMGQMEMGFVA